MLEKQHVETIQKQESKYLEQDIISKSFDESHFSEQTDAVLRDNSSCSPQESIENVGIGESDVPVERESLLEQKDSVTASQTMPIESENIEQETVVEPSPPETPPLEKAVSCWII